MGFTEADLADCVWPLSLDGQDRADLAFHGKRWVLLVERVESLIESAQQQGGPVRVLDIGPSVQTDILRHRNPEVRIDTLDLGADGRDPRPQDVHLQYDLNDLYDRERWPRVDPYDVIVMCEVIEHLHTGAETVLSGLASMLGPGGSLFLQTPNAAALHKRLQLAAGRNPYMPLDEDREHPPHFHEFTVGELVGAARNAGLTVAAVELHNLFARNTLLSRTYNRVCELLPGSMRTSISMTLLRPAAGG